MTDFASMYDSTAEWLSENALRIALAIAAAALIVFILMGVKRLVTRAAGRLGGDRSWAALIADVVRRTRWWFFVAVAARLVQGYAAPPVVVAQTISFVFVIAATMQAAIWVRAFLLGFIVHRAGAREHDSQLASAMTIIRLLVSFAVFAIATIFVLDNLGVNVTGLVAGLGVGGIAIGLAAQGIFSDLFAALSILFDRPFRVGDTIVYQGKEGPVTGHVEKIGLKSTRIRALTGELRIIANAQLLNQELTNFTGRSVNRLRLAIGVIYQTDPNVAAQITDLMREVVERAGHRFVRANFTGFGASSLDYELLFEVDSGDVVEAMAGYQRVALDLLREFNGRGIEFAYPTQTSFTAAPDGTMVLPYPENAVVPVRSLQGSKSEASP